MQSRGKRRTLFLVLTALLTILVVGPRPAAAVDALLVDDAWVDSGSTSANHGADANLVVSDSRTSYMLFDFSRLPAGTTGAHVSQAILKLWVDTVTTSGSINVYAITSSWAEETVTYSGRPSLAATAAVSNISVATGKKFITIDVSQLVKDWLNGVITVHGLALVVNASGTNVAFDSKESSGTSHDPTLQLVLSKVPGASVGPLAIQSFTSNGTYTPTAGTTVAVVECWGAGGGGGAGSGNGIGGGGGGGGEKRVLRYATPASQTVTLGSGGSAGSGGAGGSGGSTTFGSLITAAGGAGGAQGSAQFGRGDGGAGGSGGSGGYGIRGSGGGAGSGHANLFTGPGGAGGTSGGGGGGATGSAASTGFQPGGGGGGGGEYGGGAGGAGMCVVTDY